MKQPNLVFSLRNVLLYLFCGRLLLLLSFFNFMEKSRFKRLMSNLSHHPSDPGFCSWHLTNYRRSGNPPFIFPSALHSSKYSSEVSSSELIICILRQTNKFVGTWTLNRLGFRQPMLRKSINFPFIFPPIPSALYSMKCSLFYDLTRDSIDINFFLDVYCRCSLILYQIAINCMI